MKLFVSWIIIVLCVSCGGNMIKNPPEDFSTSIRITPQRILDLGDFEILQPHKVIKYKNQYVFFDAYKNNGCVKFMSESTKIVSGVREGNGPLEIIGACGFAVIEDSVFLMDYNHRKLLSVYPEKDSLIVKVSSNNSYVGMRSYPITKNRFLETSSYDSCMYSLKTLDNQTLTRINYPEDKVLDAFAPSIQNTIYVNTKFTVSPDKKHYAWGVMCTAKYGFGRIINNDLITLDTVLSYSPLKIQKIVKMKSSEVIRPTDDSKMNILACTSSSKYAMFLYCGTGYADIKNHFGKKILLYTWEGKPKKVIEVDENLVTIDYDDEKNILYGISMNPEAQLVEYNFNEI